MAHNVELPMYTLWCIVLLMIALYSLTSDWKAASHLYHCVNLCHWCSVCVIQCYVIVLLHFQFPLGNLQTVLIDLFFYQTVVFSIKSCARANVINSFVISREISDVLCFMLQSPPDTRQWNSHKFGSSSIVLTPKGYVCVYWNARWYAFYTSSSWDCRFINATIN